MVYVFVLHCLSAVVLPLVSKRKLGNSILSVDSLFTCRPVYRPVDLCRLSVDPVYLYTCIPVIGYCHGTPVDSADHPSAPVRPFAGRAVTACCSKTLVPEHSDGPRSLNALADMANRGGGSIAFRGRGTSRR